MAAPPRRRDLQTPEDAEELVRDWMMWAGFRNSQVTQRGADRGIDVRAAGGVAQVKFHAKAVGRPALQQLYGAALGAPTLFFSHMGYSKPAFEYAQLVQMALFVFDGWGTVSAANKTGEDQLRRGHDLPPAISAGRKTACSLLVMLTAVGAFIALTVTLWMSSASLAGKFWGFIFLALIGAGMAWGGAWWCETGRQRRLDRKAREAGHGRPAHRRSRDRLWNDAPPSVTFPKDPDGSKAVNAVAAAITAVIVLIVVAFVWYLIAAIASY